MLSAVKRVPALTWLLLRYLHVLGATVILGTGTGIAFFMVMAHRTRDAAFIARTAGVVVVADALFTASAVLVQPVTGWLLLGETGRDVTEPWVLASLALYGIAGLAWLPVVAIQIRLRDLARAAADADAPLPQAYHRLYRLWFALGFPGFGAVMAIIWLMVAKPEF